MAWRGANTYDTTVTAGCGIFLYDYGLGQKGFEGTEEKDSALFSFLQCVKRSGFFWLLLCILQGSHLFSLSVLHCFAFFSFSMERNGYLGTLLQSMLTSLTAMDGQHDYIIHNPLLTSFLTTYAYEVR